MEREEGCAITFLHLLHFSHWTHLAVVLSSDASAAIAAALAAFLVCFSPLRSEIRFCKIRADMPAQLSAISVSTGHQGLARSGGGGRGGDLEWDRVAREHEVKGGRAEQHRLELSLRCHPRHLYTTESRTQRVMGGVCGVGGRRRRTWASSPPPRLPRTLVGQLPL